MKRMYVHAVYPANVTTQYASVAKSLYEWKGPIQQVEQITN